VPGGHFAVGFFESGNSHGDVGLGNPWFHFDAATSAPLDPPAKQA
jgi:hypothetical protein